MEKRLVGVPGFEPGASWSRTKRDTKLRHTAAHRSETETAGTQRFILIFMHLLSVMLFSKAYLKIAVLSHLLT